MPHPASLHSSLLPHSFVACSSFARFGSCSRPYSRLEEVLLLPPSPYRRSGTPRERAPDFGMHRAGVLPSSLPGLLRPCCPPCPCMKNIARGHRQRT
jgi:hypothetical protein